jgi:hypothetical protein
VSTDLLCVGLCRRRKPRTEFRETPWYGRAASCRRCESWSPGEAWAKEREERTYWELAQAREKLRAYQRYARALRFRLLLKSGPTSGEAMAAYQKPYYDALERAVTCQAHAWSASIAEALRKADRYV